VCGQDRALRKGFGGLHARSCLGGLRLSRSTDYSDFRCLVLPHQFKSYILINEHVCCRLSVACLLGPSRCSTPLRTNAEIRTQRQAITPSLLRIEPVRESIATIVDFITPRILFSSPSDHPRPCRTVLLFDEAARPIRTAHSFSDG